MDTVQKKPKFLDFLLLFFSVAFYSCCSLFNKFATGYETFSLGFLFFYGCSLAVLAAYALLWQAVLKRFELSVAYSAKPFSTLFSMIWGVALFQETIRPTMIVGAILILFGMRVVMTDHE